MTPERKEGYLRQLQAIQALKTDELLIALHFGYINPNLDPNNPLVKAVLENRLLTELSNQTSQLVEATGHVHREVALLADSSVKLEGLTNKLNTLTIILIFLTTLAVIVPIGIEVWRAYTP